jgi:hypothetical protein
MPSPPDGLPDAQSGADVVELGGGVLGAAVCMEHDPGRAAAAQDVGHAQRPLDQGAGLDRVHCPSNNTPGEGIPDGAQKHPAFTGAQVSDVRDPDGIQGPGLGRRLRWTLAAGESVILWSPTRYANLGLGLVRAVGLRFQQQGCLRRRWEAQGGR